MRSPGRKSDGDEPRRKAPQDPQEGAGQARGEGAGEGQAPASPQGAPVARGGASVKPYDPQEPGGETSTRRYVEFPDFRKHPEQFVPWQENWPFLGDILLLNDLWVRPEKDEPAARRWSVNESGAGPGGCALAHSYHRTYRQAILAALDLKPMEHLADKRKRVEDAARRAVDPEILTVVEGLLDECRNVFGPIEAGIKYRIRDYLLEPTVEHWEDISGIIVGGGIGDTIWALWLKVDPSAPRHGPAYTSDDRLRDEWDRIPTPMEVLVALRAGAKALPDAEKG